jgi:DNA processing protein
MDSSSGLPYWLALRRAGLGSTNFSLLLKRFGTIEEAWAAPTDEVRAAGLDPQYLRSFTKAHATFDAARELAELEKHGARAWTWLDESYPALLREIPQSPPVLFVRGATAPVFDPALAVVGTRHVTPYGRQATEHFCAAVAAAGVAIVSGLARGVDAIAHRVALDGGTPTVAVLAGGIDQIYPRENAGLAERILATGCLVSEYPVGIPARPDYFPRRNRIISGLATATLVVEAGAGSGALHTANWAFEQGRDVYAVPGSIFSRQSEGTNQLIRENTARLVTSPDQLLEELNLRAGAGLQLPLAPRSGSPTASAPPRQPATEEEGRLLHYLREGPSHIDELARSIALPVQNVASTLQIMELKGLVRQERPMVYVKA